MTLYAPFFLEMLSFISSQKSAIPQTGAMRAFSPVIFVCCFEGGHLVIVNLKKKDQRAECRSKLVRYKTIPVRKYDSRTCHIYNKIFSEAYLRQVSRNLLFLYFFQRSTWCTERLSDLAT